MIPKASEDSPDFISLILDAVFDVLISIMPYILEFF